MTTPTTHPQYAEHYEAHEAMIRTRARVRKLHRELAAAEAEAEDAALYLRAMEMATGVVL